MGGKKRPQPTITKQERENARDDEVSQSARIQAFQHQNPLTTNQSFLQDVTVHSTRGTTRKSSNRYFSFPEEPQYQRYSYNIYHP